VTTRPRRGGVHLRPGWRQAPPLRERRGLEPANIKKEKNRMKQIEPIRSFEQLLDLVKKKEKKVLAIASAEGKEIIQAAKLATDENILFPIFIGDREKIEKICKEIELELNKVEIVNEKDINKTSEIAVELVKKKRADMLMKGKVDTRSLLKAVLDKEKGLRADKLLSHVAVVEVKSYSKLMLVTDGGMNINPDVNNKIEILKNAIDVAHRLGIEKPKISVLAAVETVNPDMPETVDASVITKMGERGDLGEVIIDGPLAFDIAIDKKSAEIKGVESLVAGETDIFLVPNISAGNIMVKALIYLADAKVGGIIVGGGAPIVLLSRSDSKEAKLYSMALGAMVS
jgi:phosphate butyryltransferase